MFFPQVLLFTYPVQKYWMWSGILTLCIVCVMCSAVGCQLFRISSALCPGIVFRLPVTLCRICDTKNRWVISRTSVLNTIFFFTVLNFLQSSLPQEPSRTMWCPCCVVWRSVSWVGRMLLAGDTSTQPPTNGIQKCKCVLCYFLEVIGLFCDMCDNRKG